MQTLTTATLLLLFLGAGVAPSEPEQCVDLSGRWAIPAAAESCRLYEGSGGELALQLPHINGYLLPQLPAVIAIEQRGCDGIRFEVVTNEATEPWFDFTNRESTFELSSNDERQVSWSDDTLTVRHRVYEEGGVRFPGIHRTWAEWSLEKLPSGRIDYSYTMTKRGATLFVFPYKNSEGSSCFLEPAPE